MVKHHMNYFFSNSPLIIICEFLGAYVMPSTHHHRPKKFDARATRCLFLGYPYGKKGYQVYDLSTGKIFVSCDVLFHENIFPFPSSATDSSIVLPHTQASFSNNTFIPPSPIDPPSSGTYDTSEEPSSPPASITPTSPTSSSLPPITQYPPDAPNPYSRPTRGAQVPGYLREYHVGV